MVMNTRDSVSCGIVIIKNYCDEKVAAAKLHIKQQPTHFMIVRYYSCRE